jgi:hypothetical protein
LADKTQHHANWRKPGTEKGGPLISLFALKIAAFWPRKEEYFTLPDGDRASAV